jgi:hypothetical protein
MTWRRKTPSARRFSRPTRKPRRRHNSHAQTGASWRPVIFSSPRRRPAFRAGVNDNGGPRMPGTLDALEVVPYPVGVVL